MASTPAASPSPISIAPAALVPMNHDRVQAGVLREKEHLPIVQLEHASEIGVDDAAVRDDEDVTLGVLREDRLDDINDAALEVGGGLAAGSQVPRGILVE